MLFLVPGSDFAGTDTQITMDEIKEGIAPLRWTIESINK